MMQRVLPWIVWPALVAGGMAAVSAAIAAGVPAALALVALQVSTIAIVGGLERWMPEHRSWNRSRNDVRTDATHFLVSAIIVAGALRFLIFGTTPSLGLWPTRWPVAAQLALALLLSDVGSFATHILTHRVKRLWPIHAVHHSSHRLYWLNGTRMHPLDAASTVLVSLLPLALLGVPVHVLALFDAVTIVHILVQHSNVRLRAGALSWIFATAEFHRWHHSTDPAEGEHNYATFFALLDVLCRTIRIPTDRSPPEVVGLYGGASMPDGWKGQARHPFVVWSKK